MYKKDDFTKKNRLSHVTSCLEFVTKKTCLFEVQILDRKHECRRQKTGSGTDRRSNFITNQNCRITTTQSSRTWRQKTGSGTDRRSNFITNQNCRITTTFTFPQVDLRNHKNFDKISGQASSSHSQYKIYFLSTCFPISGIGKHVFWIVKTNVLSDTRYRKTCVLTSYWIEEF
jgi:hypothetical protein